MATLVSPGVSVSVIDQSFYIPGAVSSISLVFIATASSKTYNGAPCLGTQEYGVVRTLTSLSQLLSLYGIPTFYTDANGNPQHGDARNEYGLDAAAKILEIANVVYVVRANVNLDDNYADLVTLWDGDISNAGDTLFASVTSYISQYNVANNLVPADSGYKQTVTQSELIALANSALVDVLDQYSFSSTAFKNAFVQDHTTDYPGFQDAVYTSTAGFITASDATGLNNDGTAYGFNLHLVSINGSQNLNIQVQGQNVQTFGTLAAQLQSQIQALSSSNTTVSIFQGMIRITSDLLGATSSVVMSDGFGGVSPLFANTNLFSGFDTPTPGVGIQSLNVYNSTFTSVIGSYLGLDGAINAWNQGSIITNQFTAQEAETILLASGTLFESTKEFLNYTSLGANDAAKRAVIVQQLNAIINNTALTNVTSDLYAYNVAACPGYWEVVPSLLALSVTLKEEVMVIGETPFDKPCTGPNSIVEWAGTPSKVSSYDVAYYWPHGLTTNIDGAVIMTTASSEALKVYAFNDQVAYVWYAPAGVNRGQVTDYTTIGYVSGTLGTATTFVTDYVDQGERDVLYVDPIDINPISFIIGRGILVMGQKTTYGAASALSRVNASRLVKLIKRTLRRNLFVYLFEPDDATLWGNISAACSSYLGTLLSRRALNDFAVLCDASTNTPATVEEDIVNVDVALQITPAAEFIIATITVVALTANINGGQAQPS